jgi:hypothetical protein
VRLRNGKTVEVVMVRKCNDVLRSKDEVEAKMTGATLKATYGPRWQSIYYEADAFCDTKLLSFQPNDVIEILDTRL